VFNVAFYSADLQNTFILYRNKAKEVEDLTSQFRQRDQDNEMNSRKSVNANYCLIKLKHVAVSNLFFP
jgi:hypothetical protein